MSFVHLLPLFSPPLVSPIMKTKSYSDMECSIARSLDIVGSWWSLMIVRDAMGGARRFKQFERSLGIAKNTLTSRLNELVENEVLRRVPGSNGSAYDEYELTEKGRDLIPLLIMFAQWGDKWAAHPKGRPYAFIDRRNGEELTTVWPRNEHGQMIDLTDIGAKFFRRDMGEPS